MGFESACDSSLLVSDLIGGMYTDAPPGLLIVVWPGNLYFNMLLGDSDLVGRRPRFEMFCSYLFGHLVQQVFLWHSCHGALPQVKPPKAT